MKISSCAKSFVAVLLMLGILSGCGGSTPEQSSSRTSDLSTQQSGDTSASSTPQGEVPPSEAFDFIEEYTEPFDGTELRRLTNLPDDYNSLAGSNEKSLLTTVYTGNGIELTLTDLESGEIYSKSYQSESVEAPFSAYLVNGKVLVTNYSESEVYVLDETLTELSSLEAGWVSNIAKPLPDGRIAFVNAAEDSIVAAQIGDDGALITSEIKPKLPEQRILSEVCGIIGDNEFVISIYDDNTYDTYYGVVFADSGEFIPLSFGSGYFVSAVSDTITAVNTTECTAQLFSPAEPDVRTTLSLPRGAGYIWQDSACKNLYFYSENNTDGGSTMTLYRYDIGGRFISAKTEIPLSEEYGYIYNVCESGGNVFVSAYINGREMILLWQPETLTPDYGYDWLMQSDYITQNAQLAEKMQDKYNVNVNYGSAGVRYFYGYAVMEEDSESLINSALLSLDSVLSKFPEGFVKEVGNGKPINCYFTGKIIPDTENSQSIDTAAGFANSDENGSYIVVDISDGYSLESTFAHEIMHLIEITVYDHRYDENWNETGFECFRRWDMLNPEDFSYIYSYADEDAADKIESYSQYCGTWYSPDNGTDVNAICFVDEYALTFPSEDMARIFETIALCSAPELPAYFKSEHMQLKMAYFTVCIRDVFETVTDDTELFWEIHINPEYDLQYFRDNYDYESYLRENAVG